MNPSEPAVMLSGDIPCRKCGYNLRGLASDGRCPECGTPVGVSVNGDLLRYSDPRYIRDLRLGISFTLWNVLVAFLISIGVVVVASIFPKAANSPILYLLGLGAGVLGIVGAWLLTEPDPSGIGEDQYGTARRLIRVTLIIGALHSIFEFMLSAAAPVQPGVRIALQGLQFVVGLVQVVGQAAELNYLSKLAMRIPDNDLANRANFLMWWLSISMGIIVVLGFLVAALVGGGARAGGIMFIGCGMGLASLFMLVLYIMYLVMLVRFGRAFDEQRAIAEQIWSQANA